MRSESHIPHSTHQLSEWVVSTFRHLSPLSPCSAAKWWRWYRALEASDLFDVFVGQLCSSLKCDNCKNISLTFDPFWELSVSLPKVRSPDSVRTLCALADFSLSLPHLSVTQVPIPQITMEHPTLVVTLVTSLLPVVQKYIFKTV